MKKTHSKYRIIMNGIRINYKLYDLRILKENIAKEKDRME